MKGQPGQWSEEWAAVVRWADRMQDAQRSALRFSEMGADFIVRESLIAGARVSGRSDGLRMLLRELAKAARP
jgi:hypothetical protein